jgi:transposase
MVFEAVEDGDGEQFGTITRIARQLDIGTESLRTWIRQAQIDRGKKRGATSEEKRRITELGRQVRELRRANEIAVLDHGQPFIRATLLLNGATSAATLRTAPGRPHRGQPPRSDIKLRFSVGN